MKKWLLSTLALGLFTCNVQADEMKQPYEKLKKQINIMSNIIASSLSQDSNRRNRYKAGVDGYYLKDQGVVFEISSNRGFSQLYQVFGSERDLSFTIDNGLGTMPIAPVAPIAPIAPIVIGDREDGITVDISSSLEAYEDAVEALRDRAESTRDMRERLRDLSYEKKSLARRQRDLEFEMRHADKDRTDDLKGDLQELREELKKVDMKMAELSERTKKEENVLQQSQDKRKKKIKEITDAYYTKLDETIVETLCNYGAGLRKMSKKEYVTFVIDMGRGRNDSASKKIHTFNKKDINACVIEDKTPEQLLKAANSYYY